jgi:hypothetical protein
MSNLLVCPNCGRETFNGVVCDICAFVQEQEPANPIPPASKPEKVKKPVAKED